MRGAKITGTCDTFPLVLAPFPFRLTGCLLLALAAILAATATPSAQVDERVIYVSGVTRDGAAVLDLAVNDFSVREDG